MHKINKKSLDSQLKLLRDLLNDDEISGFFNSNQNKLGHTADYYQEVIDNLYQLMTVL